MNLEGYKGNRLRRSNLERILAGLKEEIINFAADNWQDYSIDWLMKQIVEIWWEELPRDIEPEQLEPVVKTWEEEIVGRIQESFEPTPREEALKEIQQEALKGVL